MNNHVQTIENNIDEILSTDFSTKHDVVVKIEDIPELQYDNFSDFKSDMISGTVIVRMAPGGPKSGLFTLTATKTQRNVFNTSYIMGFLLPISGIILGIVHNYWWFLLLPMPIFALRLGKKVYLSALFGSIGASEKAFCFAFCGNAITVECGDGTICYRGMADQ